MPDQLQTLLDLLDLEPLEADLFRGESPQEDRQRVFGGHVIGQALVAATRTVSERRVHSLHAYFMRPGDPKVPIIYDVDCIRDGRSFTTRQVVARQHGRAIYTMSASFHIREDGPDHQMPMPEAPPPEDLPDRLENSPRTAYLADKAIDIRPVNPVDPAQPELRPPYGRYWARTRQPLPDNFDRHECVLAYASDMTVSETALGPHGVTWYAGTHQTASLDHSMWFHRPFRADEWLLFDQMAPSATGARGFNFGNIFTRDGRLVASMTQEALLRPKR